MRGVWIFGAALLVQPVALWADDRQMTLRDVVTLAVGNNLDVALAHADATLARDEIAIADSKFERRVVGDVHLDNEHGIASATRLPYSAVRGASSLAIEGTGETGLVYDVGLGFDASRNTSPFDAYFSPAYTTSVAFSLTQPLMRGAWSAARLPTEVAKLRHRASEADVKVRLEGLLGAVEVAYWNLVVAFKAREARQSSLELAREQLADSTRLVQLGTISSIDVVEAESGVNLRQRELVLSDEQVAIAQADLLDIIQKVDSDELIVPVDTPDAAPVKTSLADQIAIASKNRPDLAAAQAQIDAQGAELALAANHRKPALDVFLKGGVFGFAGTFQQNYATTPITDGSLVPPYMLDPTYRGGPGKSVVNLTAGDFAISLGVQLQLPFRNSAADAEYERQLHVLEKLRVARTALLVRVRGELRRALALLAGDEKLINVADDAVAVNTRLLSGMRKRFALGGTTSFDVLRVADELTRAQIAAVRARASYRVSLARLASANGTLLQTHGLADASMGK